MALHFARPSESSASPATMREQVTNRHRLSALAGTIVLLAVVGSTDAALVAPPPNDTFGSAQVLAGESGTVTGTNVDATKEPGEPRHAGIQGGASVWYRWTAPRDGAFGFGTQGSSFDTLLAVYTTGADPTRLVAVAANDDGFAWGVASAVAFRATGGATYHIAVDGWGRATGRFVLAWRAAPGNDDFRNAYPLSGSRGRIGGTNVFATLEPGEPRHGGASLWYRWRAPGTRPMTVTTRGSNFDTVLSVYTGGGIGGLRLVARNDDAGLGVTSVVRFRAIGGRLYRIAVAGYDADIGRIRLGWRPAKPPRAAEPPRLTGSFPQPK